MYFEILSRVSNQIQITVILDSPPRQPLPSNVRQIVNTSCVPIKFGRLSQGKRRRTFNKAVEKANSTASAVHCINFSTPNWRRPSTPLIVSLYDMVFEHQYDKFGDWIADAIREKHRSLALADMVVTISETSRSAVTRFFPELGQRIHVLHLGYEHMLSSDDNRHPPPSNGYNYALFVGQRVAYKNFRTLLYAVASPSWPSDLKLLVAGPLFNDMEQLLIKSLGIQDYVQPLGHVTDVELARFYKQAACFIFPSLEEGFGLPTIEAQVCGCPVVLADIPIFNEVAGDSALYFSPYSVDALVGAVKQALDPSIRADFVKKGFSNIQRFTWERAAAKLASVYTLCSESSGSASQSPNMVSIG